jgi:hypothetical protein
MTESFKKVSGDVVNLRKYMTDLSKSFGRQMKELKGMMDSIINSRTDPTRGSPKRKKGKSSGAEKGSSSDETRTHPSILESKSWDSMCESDGESHRNQRAARPAISTNIIAMLVLGGTVVY